MIRRRARTTLWLLLPLFALRSLVPSGFMLDVSDSGLSVMICDAADEHPSSSLHANDEHHCAGKLCGWVSPVSGTVANAFIPELPSWFIGDVEETDVVASHTSFGPVRVHQSRAPPLFS